ncbi:hypothetical protein STAS_10177 [Striga asiatica]|uniref:Uncharacterized protein n=1 Tax=Striga asiatica TaxID=4170 RepID=A0A5A7PNA4_STRAF|nr:hypothetical protein STAS_10177 [Striga asiatica]
MRRHQHRRRNFSLVLNSDSDSNLDFGEGEEEDDAEEESASGRRRRRRMKMKCLSCKEDYDGETEEELKREIEDLKSKVNFLRLLSVEPGLVGPNSIIQPNTPCSSYVVLVASGSPNLFD